MYESFTLRLRQDHSGFLEILGPPSSPRNLQETQAVLGPLPRSFQTFAGTIGSASLHSGDTVYALHELTPLDIDLDGATGLIPLVRNVDSCGDLLAFNPHESSTEGGEWPLYLISHDPLAVELASPSFGSWLEDRFRTYTDQPRVSRVLLRTFSKPRHHLLAGIVGIAIGLLLFGLIQALSGSHIYLLCIASASLFFGVLLLIGTVLSYRRTLHRGSA